MFAFVFFPKGTKVFRKLQYIFLTKIHIATIMESVFVIILTLIKIVPLFYNYSSEQSDETLLDFLYFLETMKILYVLMKN